MLGFHRRTRSLIPVKELAKYDKVPLIEEEEDAEIFGDELNMDIASRATNGTRWRQLMLVYVMFLAEAYVHFPALLACQVSR
jgi:hypothetical protein